MRKAGLALAVLGAVALAAAPSRNTPVPVFGYQMDTRQYPVEQESPDYFFGDRTHPETWVNNPTACDWDPDDASDQVFGGTLPSHTSVSTSRCVMADGYDNFGGDQHNVQVYVTSKADDLSVILSNDQGQVWHASRSGSHWLICARDHTSSSVYPIVPGSNGGTGFPVTYILTITGGAHDARNTWALLQTGFTGIYSECPTPYPDDHPG